MGVHEYRMIITSYPGHSMTPCDAQQKHHLALAALLLKLTRIWHTSSWRGLCHSFQLCPSSCQTPAYLLCSSQAWCDNRQPLSFIVVIEHAIAVSVLQLPKITVHTIHYKVFGQLQTP